MTYFDFVMESMSFGLLAGAWICAAAVMCESILLSVSAMPFLMGWVSRNGVSGFRIPRSLSSDTEWYRLNRTAARNFIGAAGVQAVLCVALKALFPDALFILAGVALAVLPPVIATAGSVLSAGVGLRPTAA